MCLICNTKKSLVLPVSLWKYEKFGFLNLKIFYFAKKRKKKTCQFLQKSFDLPLCNGAILCVCTAFELRAQWLKSLSFSQWKDFFFLKKQGLRKWRMTAKHGRWTCFMAYAIMLSRQWMLTGCFCNFRNTCSPCFSCCFTAAENWKKKKEVFSTCIMLD